MAKSRFGWAGKPKEARRIINKCLVLMGNEAVNFFGEGFRKQGFTDVVLHKWKSRKSKRDAGRAILVKSGDMRRSLRKSRPNMSNLSIMILAGDDKLKYARFHNEGTARLPKRQFIGDSRRLNKKIEKTIESQLNSLFK